MRFRNTFLATLSLCASFALAKKVTLIDGTTYAYTHHAPSSADKPTLLLLHGYPATRADWSRMIPGLTAAGYGVVAPDLLGFGETDVPEALEDYSFVRTSSHITEILDYEGLDTVVGVGHDVGTEALAYLAVLYPERFEKYVFLATGYSPPAIFNLDEFLSSTKELFGHQAFGYWRFFNKDASGPIMDEHVPSVNSLAFPANNSEWIDTLSPVGAARKFVESDRRGPLPSWMTRSEFNARVKLFEAGGYTGPNNWYKARIRNIDREWVESLTDDQKHIHKPFLQVLALQDPLSIPKFIFANMKPWVKNPTARRVEAGHWLILEKPKVVVKFILDFLDEGY